MARLFSPFNISSDPQKKLSDKYDFMVAISGETFMGTVEQENLNKQITEAFNKFLVQILVPSLVFIIIFISLPTFYAFFRISKRINHLTDMVNNNFKSGVSTRSSSKDQDEIAKLESLFTEFFNSI